MSKIENNDNNDDNNKNNNKNNNNNDNVNVTLLEFLITVFCTLGLFVSPCVEYEVSLTYNIYTWIVPSNGVN